jgi:conjugal transfer ATP-binding protein TraC
MFTIVEYLAARGARARERYAHRGPWGGRHFLVIDEGWKMLERKSTGRWINEQARRSRHNRLFLVAISQQLSDFTQHAEGAALVSQSSIQLFLRQHPEQAAFIQKTLNLTDSETDTIANLKTVKGQYSEAYLINGRRGRGLVQIRAGAAEYWYATSEPDHDQPLRNRVLAQHDGDMWAALADLAENHAPLTA